METNKSSGSRRPAENADQSPSELQYVEHHTTPGRAATNGYGFNHDLTPNSSDVPDPGPYDTVMTDEEYSAIHERLLQEPLTPEELQAIENGAVPGTYEELVARSSQFPNIHGMFNRIVIDHDCGYENISVSSMSTASASHQPVVAPEVLGPATLGQLSQSVASSAGHSIAQSSTSNQSPRRVQVGPPVVSQETCNGLHGRGGCMALVWQPGAKRCLSHSGGSRIVGKSTIKEINTLHALGIWCCTRCYTAHVSGPSQYCPLCRLKEIQRKSRKAARINSVNEAPKSNSVNNGGVMIHPYDPSTFHSHTLGIGSSSTPVTMPSIPQIQPSGNIGSGPIALQPFHTTGHSINGSSFVSGNGGPPFNFQDSFYSPSHSFGHQPAPTLAHDPSDNASSSSSIPAHSSTSAQQSEDQDRGYNDFNGNGLQ